MDCFTAALTLAEMGYAVFPLSPGSKEPLAASNGLLDATCDHAKIESWWTSHGRCNIGLRTDGLLVVDVDVLKGNESVEDSIRRHQWLAQYQERLFDESAGVVETPRGGKHYYFHAPDGTNYRNTESRLTVGVDTRANGGYVVAPPSKVKGKSYQWIRELSSEACYAPGWLLDQLEDKPDSQSEVVSEDPDWVTSPIPERHRNSSLASLAGWLRWRGMTRSEIDAVLQIRNQLCCKPPLSSGEVGRIAKSVSRYLPDQISTAVAMGWDQWWLANPNDQPESTRPVRLPDPGMFPKALLKVPGLIGEIVAWNLETARHPQPELALAAAISLMGTLAGRKVQDETGLRTNVYCIGVCGSGGGKEHARKLNKDLLEKSGLGQLYGPEGLASHAGIVSVVEHHGVVLFQVDEVGRLLKTLQNPGAAPHLYNIITVLLKLFSSANSLYVGDAYKDIKTIPKIREPHACIYATTVKNSLYESLTAESLSDGFAARLMIFETSDNDPEPRKVRLQELPDSLLKQVAWWGAYQPGGNLGSVNPSPRTLEPTAKAEAIFDEFSAMVRDRRRKEVNGDSLWTRAYEKARKLSLIRSISDDCHAGHISEDAAWWACEVSKYLTERMEFIASRWVAGSQHDSRCKAVLRAIETAGDSGVAKNELALQTRFLRPRERDEVIADLLTAGQIETSEEKTGGRPRMVYKVRK